MFKFWVRKFSDRRTLRIGKFEITYFKRAWYGLIPPTLCIYWNWSMDDMDGWMLEINTNHITLNLQDGKDHSIYFRR